MVDIERGPQRTCIACRQVKDKRALIRYVAAPDGTLIVDYLSRLPGRGAYTCIDAQCIFDAVKKNSFQRSFKGRCLPIDAEQLLGQVTSAVEKKITSLIGMARKSRQFIAGSNAVTEALKKGSDLALVIIATDISTAIEKKIVALALRNNIDTVHFYDKQMMGQLLGREERSVIAIQSGLLADSLLKELHLHRTLLREN
jgi:predicted RNA-binding protein YlxR (DUF448 family)